jgi:hypothetical protein
MLSREPFRPFGQAVGPEYMRSFSITAPLRTHWRPASCAEVDCPHYLHGWASEVDETTELGQFQAAYIRTESGRGFRESRTESGLTRFEFTAGQTCFRSDEHRTRIEEARELYVVRDGDWRGNPRRTTPLRLSADGWVNEFGENQERLIKVREGA